MEILDLAEAHGLVADAVASMGAGLVTCSTREVHHRPGREVIVGFDVGLDWPVAGVQTDVLWVRREVCDGSAATQVWRYPEDPLLPGLADAVWADRVAAFLDRPDLAGGVAATEVRIEMVALRPCRRAVVHVTGPGLDIHLKVVPPAEVDLLVAWHEAFAAAGLSVPPVVAVDAMRGWVALATLPGETLAHRLVGRSMLPADDVASLLRRITTVVRPVDDDVPSSVSLASKHGAVLIAALAPVAGRVDDLVRALTARDAALGHSARREATVHGDLHSGQLLVDAAGAVVGLLDLDAAGRGDVVDEAGRMLADVIARAVVTDGDAADHWGFAADLYERWSSDLGAEPLSVSTTASLLGQATGPWRSQDPDWPGMVDALLAAAEDVLARGGDEAIRSRRSP